METRAAPESGRAIPLTGEAAPPVLRQALRAMTAAQVARRRTCEQASDPEMNRRWRTIMNSGGLRASACRWPISRVLSGTEVPGRSSLWEHDRSCPRAVDPRRPDREGLSLAAYLTLLRLGFAMPHVLPHARWALTPPFHPCRSPETPAVCFLLHCPSPAWPVPRCYLAVCPRSPDFPPTPQGRRRPSGHLHALDRNLLRWGEVPE
jgi:hypothetical protein